MTRGSSFGRAIPAVAALAVLTVVLLVAAEAGRPGGGSTGPKFKLTDLGYMGAYCINDEGVIGGEFLAGDGFYHPVLIVPEDTDGNGAPDCWFTDADGDGVNDLMVDIGFLYESDPTGSVLGANGRGEFVGLSRVEDGHVHGFLHADVDGDGTPEMNDLGTIEYGKGSQAFDLNDDGWVIGQSAQKGFVLVPDDGVWNRDANADGANDLMIDLSTFSPVAIDDDGRIVANKSGAVYLLTPVDSDGDGVPNSFSETALSGLGGTSIATAFHSSGRIAGKSTDSSSIVHAVYWKPDLGVVDLGAPSRGFTGTACDLFVDGSGVVCVVGNENKPGRKLFDATNIALYWAGSTKYVLYEQLSDKTGVAGVETATDINSSGVFIGVLKRTSGGTAAYVAVPVSN